MGTEGPDLDFRLLAPTTTSNSPGECPMRLRRLSLPPLPARLPGLPAALAAFLCLTLLTSCSQIEDQLSGAQVSTDERDTVSVESDIQTVSWANLNGMVSVLVRNVSDRLLRHADAVITVQDASGATVGASSVAETVSGRCCTAVDVPPGGEFGFYLYAAPEDDVQGVDISYRNLVWDSASSQGGPRTQITPVNLYANRNGSVVGADVVTWGGPIDEAVVQAVIDDADGSFLAVISGTWFCFQPGPARRIRMQLFQPLPEGAEVATITAFPRSGAETGGDANVEGSCDPAAQPSTSSPPSR